MLSVKCTWDSHIMRRIDNRWTERVTKWQLKNCNRGKAGRESGGEIKLEHLPEQDGVH